MPLSIHDLVNKWIESYEPPHISKSFDMEEEFECPDSGCTATASDAGAINTHYSCVHRFVCEICNLSFIGQRYLDDHITIVHPCSFKCPVRCPLKTCDKTFSSQDERNQHVIAEHGVDPSCIIITGY